MFLFCFSGSDKEAILDLVTSRSNAQRQEIIAAYKSNFGQVNKYILNATAVVRSLLGIHLLISMI